MKFESITKKEEGNFITRYDLKYETEIIKRKFMRLSVETRT